VKIEERRIRFGNHSSDVAVYYYLRHPNGKVIAKTPYGPVASILRQMLGEHEEAQDFEGLADGV